MKKRSNMFFLLTLTGSLITLNLQLNSKNIQPYLKNSLEISTENQEEQEEQLTAEIENEITKLYFETKIIKANLNLINKEKKKQKYLQKRVEYLKYLILACAFLNNYSNNMNLEHKIFFISKIREEGISPNSLLTNIQQEFQKQISDIENLEDFKYEIPGRIFYGEDADMDISSDEE